MRRLTGFLLGTLMLGGCAVYADQVPPPVVVAPAPHVWWAWHGGWHHHWR